MNKSFGWLQCMLSYVEFAHFLCLISLWSEFAQIWLFTQVTRIGWKFTSFNFLAGNLDYFNTQMS